MKKYIIGLSAALLLFSGCSNNKVELDPSTAVEKMSEEITFTDQFAPLDSENANRVYGVDADLVEDSTAMVGSGATAESIAMFKAVDAKSAQDIEKQLEVFIDGYIEGYSDYKPEEVPKLESAIIERKDVYVVLCISADNDAAKKVVSDTLNG
ncbi:MAG TPA: DUF4358 domain-containing protein [Candidatus Butyricicoccus avistercoris]|uniref:DUF4358 domain-containing protein n=1 Tax=Candidatus Butyricicoccus avistercoris TaxID=2838518 RepID=A0A9D1TIW9_9FIRM|nr:DUF4358 domain-containing protein [Candidatus Butyricicoccus avistercoris]